LGNQQRAALAQVIESGLIPYLDGVVRWRLCYLAQAQKPTLAHHVQRTQRMGEWVLVNEMAY